MTKRVLANVDVKYFKKFKELYPGWDIIRYEDNSLEFVPPVREEVIKKPRRQIIRGEEY